MSRHHRTEVRYCVGGKWAGPDADSTFPCLVRFQHLADCADRDDCPGCLPREADSGWLCEHCHRFIQQWLSDGQNGLVAAYHWLGDQMVPLRTNYPQERRRGGDRADRAEALMSVRSLIVDRVYIAEERARMALAGRLVDEPAIADLGPFDLDRGVRFLRRHLIKIEDDPLLIAELFRKAQDSMIEAHAIAPWRRMATKVRGAEGPIACPHCERKSLMQFGGDDFVCCQSCGVTISDERFGIWTVMLEGEVS